MSSRFRNTPIIRWAVALLPVPFKLFLLGQPRPPDVYKLIRSGRVSVGRYSYPKIPPVVYYAGDTASVHIGAFTSIAGGCEILAGGEHRPDWVTTFPLRIRMNIPGRLLDGLPRSKGDVIIGNDVWLGKNSIVLSGVSIGDGAVVAAGSVVTRNVKPYSIVGGVPARELRFRFSEEQVEQLLSIAWWDWTDDEIRERSDDLCSPDIDSFVSTYGVRRFDRDSTEGVAEP